VPTTPTESRFTGAWAGTTFQGRPIAFTVSAEQRITSITVDYAMNGCTGSKTLSDLTVSIGQPGSLMGPLVDFTVGPPGGPDTTALHFLFTSDTTANGTVAFINYTGCGNGGGTWSAVKR